MKSDDPKLVALLEYMQADGRVCPQPQKWKELWDTPQ
jgi:hypothetical protein